MKKTCLALAVVTLLVVLAVAGPASARTSTKANTPVKIGIISDLTGQEATTGTLMVKSVKLAFAAIGNKINGHPVQIVVGDGQDSAATAVDVAKKMVTSDKVCAIFGPNEVGEKMAVAGYMAQAQMPMILWSPMPMAPPMLANQWVIGAGGSTAGCPTVMADYIAHTLKYKTIATMSQDGSGGHAFIDPLVATFKSFGGTVVGQQWTPVPTSDFASYVAGVPSADALVAWEAGSDAIKMLNSWYQSGKYKTMKLAAAFHGAFMDPWVFRALNPKAAKALAGTPTPMEYAPDRTSAANKVFVKLCKNKKFGFGRAPEDGSYSNGYQAALGFIQALKGNGVNTDPTAIKTAMLAARWTGPEGLEYFASGTHAAVKSFYIVDKKPNANGKGYHYHTLKMYANVPYQGWGH